EVVHARSQQLLVLVVQWWAWLRAIKCPRQVRVDALVLLLAECCWSLLVSNHEQHHLEILLYGVHMVAFSVFNHPEPLHGGLQCIHAKLLGVPQCVLFGAGVHDGQPHVHRFTRARFLGSSSSTDISTTSPATAHRPPLLFFFFLLLRVLWHSHSQPFGRYPCT